MKWGDIVTRGNLYTVVKNEVSQVQFLEATMHSYTIAYIKNVVQKLIQS